jgi:hypothetical protein
MLWMKLGLLLPKGWAGLGFVFTAATAVLAELRFSDTVTTGSVITAAVVIVLSGLFTLRNNLRSFWHDLAVERGAEVESLTKHLQEKDEALAKLNQEKSAELAHHLEEQRTLRQELKNEVAALRASLRVEQAKTDLSALMEQLGRQHTEAMENIALGIQKQQEVINILAHQEEEGDRR